MSPGEARRALHLAGRVRKAWLPGMRGLLDRRAYGGTIPLRRSDDGERWIWPCDAETLNSIVDRESLPDLSDPATVGCLLALLREASGDPHATVQHSEAVGWCVYSARGEMLWADQPQHNTEGEAISAALVALAGEP